MSVYCISGTTLSIPGNVHLTSACGHFSSSKGGRRQEMVSCVLERDGYRLLYITCTVARFEAFMAVKVQVKVFWVVIPCNIVVGTIALRNIVILPHHYTVS
jgi:hypothetical protein